VSEKKREREGERMTASEKNRGKQCERIEWYMNEQVRKSVL